MEKLVILGSGGFAREVLSFVRFINKYEFVDFVSVDEALPKLVSQGVTRFFVAIGENKIRAKVVQNAIKLGLKPVNIIHPSAVIASDVTLGEGVVIYPNVTLNTGVRVGNHVLINSNVSVGHDTLLGDCSTLNPGANIAGHVEVGKQAFVGIGANVLQKIKIGEGAVVGGGALVNRDVAAGTTVVGVPARELGKKS